MTLRRQPHAGSPFSGQSQVHTEGHGCEGSVTHWVSKHFNTLPKRRVRAASPHPQGTLGRP